MISGAPSQDSLLPDNRHAADYQQLRERLIQELNLTPQQLHEESNLIQAGLDSIRLMRWLHWFRKNGYRLTLRELYAAPTLAAWNQLMLSRSPENAEEETPPDESSWPNMTESTPFPLTPVQHAYLTGRMPGQTLGGVGCHLYQEFEGHCLTASQLEQAITTLLQRHPMLHIAFRPDGQQVWLPQPYWNGVTVHDLRHNDAESRQAYLDALRQRLSHRLLRVEIGETFDFQLTLLPDNRHRLHVNIDLLIMDASSFTLFFDELNALLAGESLPAIDTRYDFRSYLLHQQKINQPLRDDARAYWLAKASTLPPAPVLPLACEPATLREVRNTRRRMIVPATRWHAFSNRAGEYGVTPTMALATCFSAVLARWGGLTRLLLNITLFDRQPLHPAVGAMLADFTNILLLDTACDGDTVSNLARKNQLTFTEDWEHRHWSGVELLRELKRQQRYPHGAPVVFTSNLGRSLYSSRAESPLGEPEWGISQTPQVWIDHLAFEHHGEVWLQWDSNDALFPPALVETLFDAYCQLINQLCDDESAWQKPFADMMPASQRAIRERVNATGAPIPEGLLHEGIFRIALQQPQALAVTDMRYQWNYHELTDYARRCAGRLIECGVQPGDNVAITMSKGAGQLVAVLAVLLAGAVYVPVSLDQPAARREKIYADASVRLVLICQHDASAGSDDIPVLAWQQAIEAEPIANPVVRAPTQPAYIIYTSGSTGTPKGVVISHRGALNTCCDINTRYQVGPHDRVLALSALHFDLSVYDIFGVLRAGGTLVMVMENQRRDPHAWCELIQRHQVTLWNSVPALFDMLLTWCEGFADATPENLRAVMLSGDWIGLDLPARYRAFRPQGQFIAMGGATEASIWSNACEIHDVPAHWRSIPYGFPLTNQRYRVVDEQGRDCPDWVPGELWIGGIGVAEGYFNDPLRSEQQFLTLPDERWYRTGDLGCYWPDGTIEFLGRRDKQVKVGGYRIELGEIESALSQLAGVKQATVLAIGEKEKTLAAYVVPQGEAFCITDHRNPALPQAWHTLAGTLPCCAISPEISAEQVADFLQHRLLKLKPGHTAGADPLPLMNSLAIQPRWQAVVERWLAFLVPQRIVFLDALPLTANGKIDYQALKRRHTPEAENPAEADLPQGDIEKQVAALWQQLLSTGNVTRETDFFQQGGDSLLATRLTGQLHQAGYEAQLSDLFNHPRLADFAATLRKTDVPVEQPFVHSPEDRYQPFALTDVQQAYLVGRQPGFALGGVGSHFFVEFEIADLDLTRLETVWNRLIARHDMLRAIVRDGQQQVLEQTPPWVIPAHTLHTPEEALRVREKLAHQVLNPEVWPVFDLQVGYVDGMPARLWLCLDNLLLDGLSMQILLAELEHGYRYPQQLLPPLPVTFRDYLQQPSLQSPNPDSLAWWQAQLDDIPPAPALPLRCLPQEVETPRFARLNGALDSTRWHRLKKRAADAHLTPSAVLLSVWSTVLSAWSAQPEFTLNLTLFDRRPLHPQINQILGDFTSLMLLSWHPGESWLHSAQSLQQRLSQNLNHRDVSAIRVMRQLAQQQNVPAVPMPVVFTSALGFEQDNFLARRNLLKPVWGISQTPQVWFDHQIYESEGELRFNWDFVAALFPAGQVERQFEQYCALLNRMAEDESGWQLPLAALVPPVKHAGQCAERSPRVCPEQSQLHIAADESTVSLICDAFREVVGESVTPAENFFEAGATSLNLVQLHVLLQRHEFSTLTLLDLFTHPSPAALADYLAGVTTVEKTKRPRPVRRRQRRI